MNRVISDEALDILFRSARTYSAWLDRPVSDDILRKLYDLMKWGPTSANSCPARILFVRTPEAKERLRPALAPGNLEKTMKTPVTAIVGYDLKFYEKLPRLFAHTPAIYNMFANSREITEITAFRNGSLQGGYFILAARAVGLDCGPMSGFDHALIDAAFWAGSTVRTNFICNLGHGDASKLFGRSPRLSFEEACRIEGSRRSPLPGG